MNRRILFAIPLAVLVACSGAETTAPSADQPTLLPVISDGSHITPTNPGNKDFFFLLPTVLPGASFSANFTPNGLNKELDPTVLICLLSAATPGAVTPATAPPPALPAATGCKPEATFPLVTIEGADVKKHFRTGSEPSSMPSNFEDLISHYHSQYQVSGPCGIYRVWVKQGSTLLGYADVQCVTSLLGLLKVDFKKFGAVFKGTKMHHVFRIERYALCEEPGVGPCGTASVTLTEASSTPLEDPVTGFVIGSLDIPVQDEPSTTGPVTINVEGCDDLRDRDVMPLDLPTFGPCLSITADPEIVLSNPATVNICIIASTSGGQNVGVVSEDQEHRITLHRREELPTPNVHALPHVGGCEVVTALPEPKGLKGLLAALAKGQLKSAGGHLLAMLAPTPLYARRRLNLGGGGRTCCLSNFQLALPGAVTITGGDGQTGEPGSPLEDPAEVTVVDVGGEPVGGARVRFLASGDGVANPVPVPTAALTGKASTAWTLASAAGANSLVASGFGLAGTDFDGPRCGLDPFQPIQSGLLFGPEFGPRPCGEEESNDPAETEEPVLTGSQTFTATGVVPFEESFEAAGIPAGWTFTGTFGTSIAVTNLAPTHGSQFAFIATPGVDETAFGGTGGSTLTSSAFLASAGDILSLDFNFLTNDGTTSFRDFAFIQLLDASNAVVATLANANTTGASDLAVPAQGGPAPAITAGVVLTPSTRLLDGVATGPLGLVTYGPTKFGGGNGGSTGFVTSTFAIPADGTYKLLFVVMDFANRLFSSALVIDHIAVQQP